LPPAGHIDQQNGRSITFEYVMLDGVNDKPEHARQHRRLMPGTPPKAQSHSFNVFSWHTVPPVSAGDHI